MTHTLTAQHFFAGLGTFLEHTVAVVLGFIMMVVGLGLGVTMIMLPVGIVVGLLGLGLLIAGLFARFDERKA
jgi:hypothetical protein